MKVLRFILIWLVFSMNSCSKEPQSQEEYCLDKGLGWSSKAPPEFQPGLEGSCYIGNDLWKSNYGYYYYNSQNQRVIQLFSYTDCRRLDRGVEIVENMDGDSTIASFSLHNWDGLLYTYEIGSYDSLIVDTDVVTNAMTIESMTDSVGMIIGNFSAYVTKRQGIGYAKLETPNLIITKGKFRLKAEE